jgi:peptide-methionine (S)-S-oxide reductase
MIRRIATYGLPLMLVGVTAAVVARRQTASEGGRADSKAVAVLAGGCYWGVESVYRHVRGIESVTSGFAIPAHTPGSASSAPTEAVRLEYDPSEISYRQILDVFFSVVHDPTQVNRQGPDVGAEYRSMVFADSAQRAMARSYLDSLTAARVFPKPIVTEIATLAYFDPAGADQQQYAERHPTDPYIVVNDVPKVKGLEKRFPELFHK